MSFDLHDINNPITTSIINNFFIVQLLS